MVFPATLWRNKNGTLKRQNRRNINTFELWCFNIMDSQENRWIIEQINPEFSFKAEMKNKLLTQYAKTELS